MFNVFKTPEFKKALTFYKEGVKENKRSFIVSMLSAVVWCFLIVVQPYIIKRIIDEGIVEQNQQNGPILKKYYFYGNLIVF